MGRVMVDTRKALYKLLPVIICLTAALLLTACDSPPERCIAEWEERTDREVTEEHMKDVRYRYWDLLLRQPKIVGAFVGAPVKPGRRAYRSARDKHLGWPQR